MPAMTRNRIVKRADGRYMYRYMRNGKTRCIYAWTKGELLTKIQREEKLGTVNRKDTVESFSKRWMEDVVGSIRSEDTFIQYRYCLDKWILPVIGFLRLDQVTQPDVQTVLSRAGEHDLSTNTLLHVRKTLHVLFEAGMRAKVVGENPVYSVEVRKRLRRERRFGTADELARVFEAAKRSRYRYLMRFAVFTALRPAELCGLQWSDINLVEK